MTRKDEITLALHVLNCTAANTQPDPEEINLLRSLVAPALEALSIRDIAQYVLDRHGFLARSATAAK